MEASHLDDRTYGLLFGIRRSVRYHNHRRAFYERWNAVTVTVALAGGSAAAAAFLAPAPPLAAVLASAAVAVAAAVDVAVGTARSGNHHAELARRFIWLERRFAHDRDLTDEEHEELTRARLDIEATEPSVLRLLDVICHYELLKALGDEEEPPRIPWWRWWMAGWLSQLAYTQQIRPAALAETGAAD